MEHALRQVTYSGHAPTDSVVTGHLKTFKKYRDNPAYAKYPEISKMDLATAYQMAGNRFVRNILYYSDPASKLYQFRNHDCPEANVFDHNLIWNFGNTIDTGYTPSVSAGSKATAEKECLNWEAWQALGCDQNSVIADPLFVNPAQDDYRLQSRSPVFKLGFKPIPVDRIGPYCSGLRATWPIVEAKGVREQGLPGSGLR